MFLQAACIVRFANEFLEAYKTNKNSIFIANYVGVDGDTEHYIFFQNQETDLQLQNLCRLFRYQYSRILILFPFRRYFNLSHQTDHIVLALDIISSLPSAERSTTDEFSKIQAFKQNVAHHRIMGDLESRTGDPSKRPRTSKSHRYTSILHYMGDKGDQIEPLIKVQYDTGISCVRRLVPIFLQLPPHTRTVHQSTDAKQILSDREMWPFHGEVFEDL